MLSSLSYCRYHHCCHRSCLQTDLALSPFRYRALLRCFCVKPQLQLIYRHAGYTGQSQTLITLLGLTHSVSLVSVWFQSVNDSTQVVYFSPSGNLLNLTTKCFLLQPYPCRTIIRETYLQQAR